MNKLYEWLLLHTGNEAPFYTILNCQRSDPSDGPESIRVMARTKDFKVVNISIGAVDGGSRSEQNSKGQSLQFAGQQEVIDYLATGEVKNQSPTNNPDGIQVLIEEPAGVSGSITFPPEQSA